MYSLGNSSEASIDPPKFPPIARLNNKKKGLLNGQLSGVFETTA